MRVLLAGATGMLGSAFSAALGPGVVTAGRDELDVRNPRAIDELVRRAAPEVMINCAAHVDAEAAELDPICALPANVILPGLIGTACRRAGVRLVHFSSTGCYGAWKDEPYVEEDRLAPTTVHHRGKVAGEVAVRDSGCEHLILRTGWLFGGATHHAKNFVWKRLVEASGAETLRSDTGQRGNPTFVGDVVSQTLALIKAGLCGTYNCVSGGAATRFEYVQRIVNAAALPVRLEPTGPFARHAPISPNEAALNQRLALMGLDQMPHWTDSLDTYVQALKASPAWLAVSEPRS